jgi:hypothetical protein
MRRTVSDVGKKNHQQRGRALAQRLAAPQRDLQQVFRQLFQALQQNDFICFHVGVCDAAAAALMAAVAAFSRELRKPPWYAAERPHAFANDVCGATIYF